MREGHVFCCPKFEIGCLDKPTVAAEGMLPFVVAQRYNGLSSSVCRGLGVEGSWV